MSSCDILIYVEDPGAVNYVIDLPESFSKIGWNTIFLADGIAKDYIKNRNQKAHSDYLKYNPRKILEQLNPLAVILGISENIDSKAFAFISEARLLNITSIVVIDMGIFPDMCFKGRSSNPLEYSPDWLLVSDEKTKNDFQEIGFPENNIIVCGHPHYDYVKSKKKKLDELNIEQLRQNLYPNYHYNKKIVIFAAENQLVLDQKKTERLKKFTLHGRGNNTSRTSIVLDEFLDAINLINPRPYLVLRLHPKNNVNEFTEYLNEFDFVSIGGSPMKLLFTSDIVVGMTSMLLIEASILGKTTLSILPHIEEKKWLPTIKMGLTKCVTSRENLKSTLIDIFYNNKNISSDSKTSNFPHDSIPRIIDFLNKIL